MTLKKLAVSVRPVRPSSAGTLRLRQRESARPPQWTNQCFPRWVPAQVFPVTTQLPIGSKRSWGAFGMYLETETEKRSVRRREEERRHRTILNPSNRVYTKQKRQESQRSPFSHCKTSSDRGHPSQLGYFQRQEAHSQREPFTGWFVILLNEHCYPQHRATECRAVRKVLNPCVLPISSD